MTEISDIPCQGCVSQSILVGNKYCKERTCKTAAVSQTWGPSGCARKRSCLQIRQLPTAVGDPHWAVAELQSNILLAYIFLACHKSWLFQEYLCPKAPFLCRDTCTREEKDARASPTFLVAAMLIPRRLSRIPSAVI